MARFESLTILFPMWNEERYVRRTLSAGKEACEELVAAGEIADYELLVVDDASTDATGSIARGLAAGDSHIRVIHHSSNRKLGGTLKTGFANAKGELVLYTDADLPFDLAEVRKACRLLRYYHADIVSAYRLDRTAEGPRRTFYSFVYNLAVRAAFGMRVRDVNFAFKLCRRRIFEHVTLKSEGSFLDVELLVRAHRLGYRIVQFGVDYFPRTRGVSKLSSAPVILNILGEMFAQWRDLRRIRSLPELTGAPPPPAAGWATDGRNRARDQRREPSET